MCTQQMTAPTVDGWLEDPMIRLVMDSDGISDRDMRDLMHRIGEVVAARCEPSVLLEHH